MKSKVVGIENKVVEMNKDRIVLTNQDIMLLINQTPMKAAFDKIKSVAVLDGKKYYWVYRIWSKIVDLFKKIEEDRVALAKEFCEKEEDGALKFTDAQYQFNPEQKKLFDEEIKANVSIKMTKEEIDTISERFCKKDNKGKPIKAGGVNLSFSEENMPRFNAAFSELLLAENLLPINKIEINSELLEKMNNKLDQIISLDDMIMLGKIFTFVE